MLARTSDGKDVYFDIQGSGSEILLIHGAGSDADTMLPLVSELSGGYRCVSLDRLGYRRSTHLNRDTTMDEQAYAVEAVRRASTTGPVWVFAHSSGGNVAVGYASLFPSSVRGLVLMEPALYALYPPETAPPAIDRMRKEIIPMFQRGDIGAGVRTFGQLLDVSAESIEELARLPRATNPLENWVPFGHDQPFVLDWYPSATELEHVAQPMLILEGDRTTPLLRDICRLLTDKLPNAILTTLGGCDHLAPSLRPALVAEKISEFIARHENAF